MKMAFPCMQSPESLSTDTEKSVKWGTPHPRLSLFIFWVFAHSAYHQGRCWAVEQGLPRRVPGLTPLPNVVLVSGVATLYGTGHWLVSKFRFPSASRRGGLLEGPTVATPAALF